MPLEFASGIVRPRADTISHAIRYNRKLQWPLHDVVGNAVGRDRGEAIIGKRDGERHGGGNGIADADQKRHVVRLASTRNHDGIAEARVAVTSEIDRSRAVRRNDIHEVVCVGVHAL